MFNFIRNLIGYKNHPDAVIISCYYNPTNSPERLAAFNKFYDTIKHLNHRIIECLTEDNVKPQLPQSDCITVIRTEGTLWYKEQLLNKLIRSLPVTVHYVLWVDADVLFTNKNWMVDAVEQLQTNNVVQLFENCHHLSRGETKPNPQWDKQRAEPGVKYSPRRWWKGYAANYTQHSPNYNSQIYEIRGHVGFAWGCRREVLYKVLLYDRGLIGGGDGIIAYASTGQIRSLDNIRDMFSDVIDDVYQWADKWYAVVQSKVGFVNGDLYHIWHGDIEKRQYYKRIKDFGPHINAIQERDENGLYVNRNPFAKTYVNNYYRHRDTTNDDSVDLTTHHDHSALEGFAGGLAGGLVAGAFAESFLSSNDITDSTLLHM